MITQKPTVSRLFLDLTALMAGAFVEKEIWFYPKKHFEMGIFPPKLVMEKSRICKTFASKV